MTQRERKPTLEIKQLDAYHQAIQQHTLLKVQPTLGCFQREQPQIKPEFLAKIPTTDPVHRREFIKQFLEQAITCLKVIDKDINKQISRAKRQHNADGYKGALLLLFTLVAYSVTIWATYQGRDSLITHNTTTKTHHHEDGNDDSQEDTETWYNEGWIYAGLTLLMLVGLWGSNAFFIRFRGRSAFDPEAHFQLGSNATSLIAKLDKVIAAGATLLDEKEHQAAAEGDAKESVQVNSGKPKALITTLQTLLEKLEEHAELQPGAPQQRLPSSSSSVKSKPVDAHTGLLGASNSRTHLSMSVLGTGYDHHGGARARLSQLNKGISTLLHSVEAEFFPTMGTQFGQRVQIEVSPSAMSLNQVD